MLTECLRLLEKNQMSCLFFSDWPGRQMSHSRAIKLLRYLVSLDPTLSLVLTQL